MIDFHIVERAEQVTTMILKVLKAITMIGLRSTYMYVYWLDYIYIFIMFILMT